MEAFNETALLGTAKKALDLQLLPEDVRKVLEARPEDPEREFLEVNAYLNFYQFAGTLPPRYTGAWDDEIIDEDKAVAPAELLQLQGRFELVDYQIRESLLTLWLDVLIQRNVIVNPELVITLIQQGKNLSNRTKAKIVEVIGNKGVWLLKHDPSLQYSTPPPVSGTVTWAEGNTQERKQLFQTLRLTNREESLQLLHSTWDAEPIVAKKMFLDMVLQTAAADDVPFAEALYYSEFQYRAKEKKSEKECRRILASILLRYPWSKLYQETAGKLTPYFKPTKKAIQFDLPDTEDSFWNAATMEQTFGMDARVYDIALFATVQQFWLSHFLEHMPMTFWTSFFGDDYKDTFRYWLTDKRFQTKLNGDTVPVYAASLISNAQLFHDKDAVTPLAELLAPHAVLPLLSQLDAADFEAYITKHNYFADTEQLSNGPFMHTWSLSFSEQIIRAAYEETLRNHTQPLLGKLIAQRAHHNSIDILYNYNTKARENFSYGSWNTGIFMLAQPALEIRNTLYAYKTKTP